MKVANVDVDLRLEDHYIPIKTLNNVHLHKITCFLSSVDGCYFVLYWRLLIKGAHVEGKSPNSSSIGSIGKVLFMVWLIEHTCSDVVNRCMNVEQTQSKGDNKTLYWFGCACLNGKWRDFHQLYQTIEFLERNFISDWAARLTKYQAHPSTDQKLN